MKKIVILGMILTVLIVGCQTISDQEKSHNQNLNSTLQNSIYNVSYEPYNQLTDMGVIIYKPTMEDLRDFIQLDQYVCENEISNNVLIIPKYVGTKITLNRVSYTGERYIANEELFRIESTPCQYGLLVGKECLSGSAPLGLYMTYHGNNVEYVFGTKDVNVERDYLNVALETPIVGQYLSPIADEESYLKDLEIVATSKVDFNQDGFTETVEVYKDKTTGASGEWALIIRTNEQAYALFERNYVEKGGLGFTIFEDYDDDKIHILIGYSTHQAIIYYDCVWEEGILRYSLFETSNMKKIFEWWYKLALD